MDGLTALEIGPSGHCRPIYDGGSECKGVVKAALLVG